MSILDRAKRIALALFRRKPRRENSVVINGQLIRSKLLTEEQKQRIIEALNRE